jgi:hypothetical protein
MANNRLERLARRRVDPVIPITKFREVYERLAEDSAVKYAIGAMQPIDAAYTKRTYEEGDRVQSQLQNGLENYPFGADFKYQGSVTSDTHIKAHSDIDLLSIHKAFVMVQKPLEPTRPYQGNPTQDLVNLRSASITILRVAFPQATVDGDGGKAVTISGGSLLRDVDVVIANWLDTLEYRNAGDEDFRSVEIWDNVNQTTIENKPFLHNKRIGQRDDLLNGNLRKVIRLLKSLKYDAETPVRMSSFDIASVAYRMPDNMLAVPAGYDLKLAQNARDFLRYLIENAEIRNSLKVPNELRLIFANGHATLDGLRELYNEINELMSDIEQGLARSFRKLAEARIDIK